jgi:hypothetical protein
MPKKAYTKDDNLMPDVSLPDDKPSQEKPTNKKLDALPDVREDKSTVKEEDIFDDAPKQKKKKVKRNVKLEIEDNDLDVKQGRKHGVKDSKPRRKRYGGGKKISQAALDNLAKARAKRQENIARRKAEKAKKETEAKKPQIEKPKRRQPTREEVETNFFDLMDKYETRKVKRKQAREAEEAKRQTKSRLKPQVAQKIVKKQPEKSVWDDYF